MKPLRKLVRALIGFDRRERRGTYILSVMLIVFLMVRTIAFRPGKIPDDLPPLPASGDEGETGTTRGNGVTNSSVLFIFDPNTASREELQTLGLSERQARTLVNYRNSGARFRMPEDLSRVYGIDSATVARLVPYIMIADEFVASGKNGSDGGRSAGYSAGSGNYSGSGSYSGAGYSAGSGNYSGAVNRDGSGEAAAPPGPVDLNLCTAEELVSLPGIGPVLSVRIIRYRSLLGGFVESAQLNEVYGLDSSVVNMIGSRLTVSFDSVRPIQLDSVTFGDLARHPYLGYEAARRITRYRAVSKVPVTLGAMVSSGVITPEQAERIAPYVRPSGGAVGSDYEFISSKVLK